MAEFGSLTTCSLGLITATGGLFCLAAANITQQHLPYSSCKQKHRKSGDFL